VAGKVKAVPDGTHTLTAHLSVREAPKAIEFYEKAFGARLLHNYTNPYGRVIHAVLEVGDSQFMLAEEFPGMGTPSPQALGGSPVVINIYVEDVDALFNQAIDAGAKVKMPLANQFWGDRYGQIIDPFGHTWALGSHVEDVDPEELTRRANAMFAELGKSASA